MLACGGVEVAMGRAAKEALGARSTSEPSTSFLTAQKVKIEGEMSSFRLFGASFVFAEAWRCCDMLEYITSNSKLTLVWQE